MNDPALFNTDVLIDFPRNLSDAVAYLGTRSGRMPVSAITVAESYTGVRDGHETAELEALLGKTETILILADTARMAGGFRRTYRKSHNLSITDALDAMTAVLEGTEVVTLNRKHFPIIPNPIVPYAKPWRSA